MCYTLFIQNILRMEVTNMNSYHRVYCLIDTNAIRNNISHIINNIPNDINLMPVVKADAYGHGALEVAKAISDLSQFFCVATIEEGMELRNAGIEKPILILGTLSSHLFEEAVLNDISINIYTYEMAKKLSEVCEKCGKKACIHISVDTGMNRIGLSCNEKGIEEALLIASCENLIPEGIFSHYATADEDDKTTALLQRDRFSEFCSRLKERGLTFEYQHICNSAAICDLNDKSYSAVRPGIIIYGLYPSDEVSKELGLKPALELKTHISYIKEVEAGEGISYGHSYITKEKRTIATIPVGYADGYPRALSNKGRVIINGEYAPIVGRVCMDQFMVDISHIPNAKTEDTVTLIGTDGDAVVSADEIANICGTINYEIICGIGKRVPRVYK